MTWRGAFPSTKRRARVWICVLFSTKEREAQERQGQSLLSCAAQLGAAWFVCWAGCWELLRACAHLLLRGPLSTLVCHQRCYFADVACSD